MCDLLDQLGPGQPARAAGGRIVLGAVALPRGRCTKALVPDVAQRFTPRFGSALLALLSWGTMSVPALEFSLRDPCITHRPCKEERPRERHSAPVRLFSRGH